MIASNGYALSHFKVARLYFNTFLVVVRNDVWHEKKERPKKKDVRTWESEHKECIWPEGTPSTTVKTIFSTLYIPIRIRRCGPAKWIEMYMILPSFYPNHRWFFLYVLHTSNVKWSERKIKRLKCVGWKDEVNAGKLYNNSKEEEKRDFFRVRLFASRIVDNPTRCHIPTTKKKERKKENKAKSQKERNCLWDTENELNSTVLNVQKKKNEKLNYYLFF